MWYGWTGTGLEVDLSRGRVKKSEGDCAMYEKFMGGHALITRLFWDKVPPQPEEGPFSPNNMLIFGAGPLVGTAAPTGCRTTVVTKSALTGYLTHSNMAGFWAPELKFAGYDWVGVSGKSDSPVYIYINNDKVEIRDASHLWGKNVFETQRLIREDLEDDKVQSLCIGPAGENRVHFASIEHGPGCSMSRGGAGGIMGDKRLKAIAIRGTQDVNVAHPIPFLELCHDIMRQSAFLDGETIRWPNREKGELYFNILKTMMTKLYRNFEFKRPWKEAQKEYLDFLLEHKAVLVGCFNCQTPCIYTLDRTGDEPVYWKCQSRHILMTTADIQDFDFSSRCFGLVQKYGMDSEATAVLCRFATDIFQKGILTKEDTGGQVLEWSNPEVVPALIEKIAHRIDIGDVLADGSYEAARRIGRGSEQYAHNLRKFEQNEGGSSFARGGPLGVVEAVTMLTHDRQGHGRWWDNWFGYDELLEKMKDPAEIERWKKQEKMFKEGSNPAEMDGTILGKMLAYDAECGIVRDSSGFCRNRFKKDENLKKVSNTGLQAELVSLATGLNLDAEEARKCGRRAKAITRAYNSILGERMRADELGEQFMPDYLKADNYALLRRMISEANQAMGCNAEGIPREDYLEELGLSDVARELERRGILPELVSVPG